MHPAWWFLEPSWNLPPATGRHLLGGHARERCASDIKHTEELLPPIANIATIANIANIATIANIMDFL